MSVYPNIQSRINKIDSSPTMITTGDGSTVLFFSDHLGENNFTNIECKTDSGGTVDYSGPNNSDLEPSGRSVLCYSSVDQDGVSNGVRWVPCLYDEPGVTDDIDLSTIIPLVNVFSPKVVYDQKNNTITMWFWTNFISLFDETKEEYDVTMLFDPSATDIVTQSAYGYEGGSYYEYYKPKRALCVTTGFLKKYYISGGQFYSDGSDDSYELVPIFTIPKVVHLFEDDESNTVTDYAMDNGIIWARNMSGTQCPQYGVAAISPTYDSSDNIFNFYKPGASVFGTHWNTTQVGIAQEYIEDGEVGRIRVSGTSQLWAYGTPFVGYPCFDTSVEEVDGVDLCGPSYHESIFYASPYYGDWYAAWGSFQNLCEGSHDNCPVLRWGPFEFVARIDQATDTFYNGGTYPGLVPLRRSLVRIVRYERKLRDCCVVY